MSTISEKLRSLTPREIENLEWLMMYNVLTKAKTEMNDNGMGNQSWLDGAIGIAESRSKTDNQ